MIIYTTIIYYYIERYFNDHLQGTIMSVCLMEDGTLLSASGNEIKAWDTYNDFSFGKARQVYEHNRSPNVIS